METVTAHTTNFWMSIFGIGCLGTALAYFLWQKGVQITGADKAALFTIFFKEHLHTYHLIGGLCIVVGLLIGKISTSKSLKALS